MRFLAFKFSHLLVFSLASLNTGFKFHFLHIHRCVSSNGEPSVRTVSRDWCIAFGKYSAVSSQSKVDRGGGRTQFIIPFVECRHWQYKRSGLAIQFTHPAGGHLFLFPSLNTTCHSACQQRKREDRFLYVLYMQSVSFVACTLYSTLFNVRYFVEIITTNFQTY